MPVTTREVTLRILGNIKDVQAAINTVRTQADELASKAKVIDFSANIKPADAEMEKLKTKKAEVGKNVAFGVNANTKQATIATDDLRARMAALASKAYDLRVSVKDGDAKATLDRLALRLDSIGAKTAKPEISLHGAATTIAELTAVDKELNKVQRNTGISGWANSTAAALSNVGGGMGVIAIAAASMLPALAALTGVVSGIALGLVGMTVGIGSALGVFGAAVYGQIQGLIKAEQNITTLQNKVDSAKKGTKAYKDAVAQLTKAQQELNKQYGPAAKGMTNMMNAWHNFENSTHGETLQVMGKGLNLIASILPKLTPLFDVGASYANKFLSILSQYVSSGRFSSFVKWLAQLAATNMDPFIHALQNIAVLFHAFRPAIQDFTKWVTDGFNKMTQAGANWAKTKGPKELQAFVQFAKQNGRQFWQLLVIWGKALLEIYKAVKPLTPITMVLVKELGKLIANTPPKVLTAIAAAFLAIKAAGVVAGPIVKIAGAFEKMGKFAKAVKDAGGVLKAIKGGSFNIASTGMQTAGDTMLTASENMQRAADTMVGAGAENTAGGKAAGGGGGLLGKIGKGGIIGAIGALAGLGGSALWSKFGPGTGKGGLTNSQNAWAGIGVSTGAGAAAGALAGTFVFPGIGTAVGAGVGAGGGALVGIMKNWKQFKTDVTNFFKGPFVRFFTQSIPGAFEWVGGKITGAFKNAWGAVVTTWNVVWNSLKAAWGTIVGSFLTAWKAVVGGFSTSFNAVKSALLTVWNAIAGAWKATWNGLKLAWNVVINAFKTEFNAVRGALSTVWNAIAIAWKNAWNGLKAAWNVIIGAFKTAFNGVKTALTTAWNAIATAWKTVWNGLKTAWTTVLNAFKTAFNTVKAGLNTAWNAIIAAWKAVWNGLKSFFSTLWNGIKTVFTSAYNSIKSGLSAAWNAMKTAATTIWNSIKTFFTTTWNAIKTLFTTTLNAIKTLLTNAWNAIKTTATTVWNAIKTFFTTTWNALKTLFTNTINAIKTLLLNAWNSIKTTATNVWNSLKSFFVNTWNSIKNTANTTVNWLKSTLSAAWNNIKNTAVAAWNGMVTGISNVWSKIKSAVKGPVDWILSNVWNPFANLVNKVLGFFGIGFKLPTGSTGGGVGSIASSPGSARTHGLAAGGAIHGEGTGTSDSILAWLSNGEYVIPANRVQQYGVGMMDAIRTGKFGMAGFQGGGLIGDITGALKSVGGAIAGGVKKALGALGHLVRGAVGTVVGPVVDGLKALMGHMPGAGTGWGKTVIAIMSKPLDAFVSWVKGHDAKDKAAQASGNLPHGGSAGQAVSIGKAMAAARGWTGSQWQALLNLWNQESGWNPNAVNPSSGAYGIPQALGHGHPYALGDVKAQIAWGLNYIASRYGTPAAAWAHELQYNWYSKGGPVSSFANGGWINEPVMGWGKWTHRRYMLGEHGAERVVPHFSQILSSPAWNQRIKQALLGGHGESYSTLFQYLAQTYGRPRPQHPEHRPEHFQAPIRLRVSDRGHLFEPRGTAAGPQSTGDARTRRHFEEQIHRLDRLINLMERMPARTALGISDALNGVARSAVQRGYR